MDTLRQMLRDELLGYAREALNGYSYLTSSADGQFFAVVSIGQVRGQRIVEADLVVRVAGDRVIVERDINDKPLVDALVAAGVPREQIVLAYAGESTADAA